MANEQDELRRVNWNELFGFTHIFKGFRMAIHPSKMALALGAIVIVLVCGWVMDLLWGAAGQYARDNEINNYAVRSSQQFDDWKDKWLDSRATQAASLLAEAQQQRHTLAKYKARAVYSNKYLADAFDRQLSEYNKRKESDYKPPDVQKYIRDAQEADANVSELLDEAQDVFDKEVEKIRQILPDSFKAAKEKIEKDESLKNEQQRSRAVEQLRKGYQAALQALSARKVQFAKQVAEIRGRGIFRSLLRHEWDCARKAISAAESLRFTAGLDRYQAILRKKSVEPIADYEPFRGGMEEGTPGVLFWLLMGYQGVAWLFTEHWLFGIILGLVALATWALLGGAIHRIAALHACRDEKISIRSALEFSAGKFLSFLTAPLIPLAIILVIGLMIALGAIAANIPVVGPIIVGALFFLAILAGLVIAFLLIGLVGGGSLMYPTIAVEGSDSFDAISRSYSYVFSRPWRSILYALVAMLYGAITYVFVRLFVYVALASAHCFAKWFVWTGGETLSPQADRIDVLWTAPQFQQLFGPFSWAAMSTSEKVAAFLIGVWVFLTAASVGAYLLSFFASSSTCIYLLLRRLVDATDLDDVYIEESTEQFEQPAAEQPAEQAAEQQADEQETPEAEQTDQEKPKPKRKKKKKTSQDEEK